VAKRISHYHQRKKKKKKDDSKITKPKTPLPPTKEEIARLPYVAHATTSVVNPILIQEFIEKVCVYYRDHPLKHNKLVPSVSFIDGEKRFQLQHFFKYSIPDKLSSSHTYKKLNQLDLEMHRLFGFFTTTEFLFATRYKDLIVQAQWNDPYFNAYLQCLGELLTNDFDAVKENSSPSEESSGSSGVNLPRSASISTPQHARRRSSLSLSGDDPTLAASLTTPSTTTTNGTAPPSPTSQSSSSTRRRSLLEKLGQGLNVTPRKQSISEEGKEKSNK